MSNNNNNRQLPARTHAEAAAMFRRPFAPGAIGFRAMTKVPYNGQPYAGAQVAAYIGAQSVIQRLNAVVPGRWRQQFQSDPGRVRPRRHATDLPRLPADRHAPGRGGRPRRRRGLRGPRRDGPGLVRRREGAVLRRAQARRGRRRDRRLPVHVARGGRAADRTARPPGAGDPPAGQERPARPLRRDRAVAAPRLRRPG